MSNMVVVGVILLSAACTLFLRALPFTLLGGKKMVPEKVRYLGRILPPAIMAVLIVYCLRDIQGGVNTDAINKVIAVGSCVLIHLWKRNTLLSIAVSTGIYMVLCAIL